MRVSAQTCAKCIKVFEWRFGVYTGVMSSVLLGLGYIAYLLSLSTGHTVLNATTWGLWTLGAIVTLLLYEDMTKDIFKSLPLFIDAVVIGFIFLFAALTGTFTSFETFDIWIIIIDFFILGFWVLYRKRFKHIANLFLQAEIFITFLPTIHDVIQDPTIEAPLAWGFWTFAYLFMLITTCFRWKDMDSIITPISYLLLQGIVFAITLSPYLLY